MKHTRLRIFFLDADQRPTAAVSSVLTPWAYARALSQYRPQAVMVAWERETERLPTVGADLDKWLPRCLAAIEADHHFFPTKEAALAVWTEVRLLRS